MGFPDVSAGQRLTAGMVDGMQIKSVEQGTEKDITSSTTLADTSIVVPVLAGATYRYWLSIGYASADTADDTGIKFAWSADTGIEVRRWSWGLGASGSGDANDFTSVNFRRPVTTTAVIMGASGSSATNSYYEQGLMIGGTDDGDATFQFAQNTSSTDQISITGSSRIDYIRIG